VGSFRPYLLDDDPIDQTGRVSKDVFDRFDAAVGRQLLDGFRRWRMAFRPSIASLIVAGLMFRALQRNADRRVTG